MMNRRKFLTSAAVAAAGVASPLAVAQTNAATVGIDIQKNSAHLGVAVSDEVFDKWVQELLQSLANGLGLPYQRLANEYAELRQNQYTSSRAMLLGAAEAELKSKKVLPG